MKIFKLYILLFLSGLIFWSCSTPEKVKKPESGRVDYSLVYLIHGDAEYSYHLQGKKYEADEQVLQQAKDLGEKAKHGEVVIFHLKPEKKRFLIFPGKDRVLYHYVNGKLVSRKKYSPDANEVLAREANWYMDHANPDAGRKVMLYFGHEIPTFEEVRYHRSLPERSFHIREFAPKMYLFGGNFDLTVLSTCNNGNPLTVDLMSDKTEYLVASPQNLHLSHLKTKKLQLLEANPEIVGKALADSLARHSFDQMKFYLQTMITIGVYDLEKIGDYIGPLSEAYGKHLLRTEKPAPFEDNTDCQNLDFGKGVVKSEGIKLYFKPPAFGSKAGMKGHSGWGCIKGK